MGCKGYTEVGQRSHMTQEIQTDTNQCMICQEIEEDTICCYQTIPN